MDVPIISIDGDRATVGARIDETLRTVGFFQIVDHGVPADVADTCWSVTRDFFALPDEVKREIERRPGDLYGYFPMRSEALAASRGVATPGDLKESVNIGPVDPPDHEPVDETEAALFAPNRWPSGLPAMRPAWEAYFRAMGDLSDRLLSVFALGLGLSADHFAAYTAHGASALRAIEYPARTTAPEPGQLRAGAHTDYGTLTILRQETGMGGLQVFDERADVWLDVPAVEGAFVVNIGDLMARWTNDRWTSTLHRVVDPPDGRIARRQSMPFFHNADYDAVIECLPTCIGDGAKYEPVQAGPHLAGKTRKSVARPGGGRPPIQ